MSLKIFFVFEFSMFEIISTKISKTKKNAINTIVQMSKVLFILFVTNLSMIAVKTTNMYVNMMLGYVK